MSRQNQRLIFFMISLRQSVDKNSGKKSEKYKKIMTRISQGTHATSITSTCKYYVTTFRRIKYA